MSRVNLHAVANAMDLLEYFAASRSPATAKDVSHALGLTVTRAASMLQALIEREWLRLDIESALYIPTRRLTSLIGSVRVGLRPAFDHATAQRATQRISLH